MQLPPVRGPAGRSFSATGSSAIRPPIAAGWSVAAALLLFAAAGPAEAVQVFATFTAVGSNNNVRLVNSGMGVPDLASGGTSASLYSTASGNSNSFGFANTRFSFVQGPLASAVSNLPAWFELSANIVDTPATVDGGDVIQPGINGFFRFTSQGAFTVGTASHPAGTQLLRGDFTLARLAGQNGGASAVLSDTLTGDIVYGSDLASFDFTDIGSFRINIASIASQLGLAGSGSAGDPYRAVRSFRGSATGNFSGDDVGAISAVPEPETWAMLVAGFVMIGFQQRRRARNTIVAS